MNFHIGPMPGRLHYQRTLKRLEKFAAKQSYRLLFARTQDGYLHAYAIGCLALLLCRLQGRSSGIEAYLKATEVALQGLTGLAQSDKDREVIARLRTIAQELAVLPIGEP